MAGPRRSPFDQADDGHPVYSPLANLVRKASNHQQHSGRIPTLSSLANSHSTGARTMDHRQANTRNVSDEPRKKYVPPSLVLSQSPEVSTGHRRAQPSSPLLHTRFRASVATSIGSSSDLDSQPRDSQELHYHHQPHSSGSDYTPSPTAHRPFQYIIDDTHAGGSPTSQYSVPVSPHPRSPLSPASTYTGPPSPNTAPTSPGLQFDARTSVAPSDITSTPPFQYDPRSSAMTDPRASSMTDTVPFHYDLQPGNTLSSNDALSHNMMRASTRSSTAYNPRGTWRSSAAPDPDPFSFRDYEAPRVEPPIVVVHSPMSTIQDTGDEDVDGGFFLGERAAASPNGARSNSRDSNTGSLDEDVGKTSYHDAYEYVYGAIEAEEDQDDDATETGHQRSFVVEPEQHGSQPAGAYSQQGMHPPPPIRDSLAESEGGDRFSISAYTDSGSSYFTPEPAPIVNSNPGRVASVTAGGARYNYSRPMRPGGGSISGTAAIQPQPSSGAPQAALSLNTNISGPSGQVSPVSGPVDGRAPIRKGTGPLIFQSNSPVEERTEYPYQYSPGPATATSESYHHSSNGASQSHHHPQYSGSSYQTQQASASPRSQPRDMSPGPGSQPRGLSPQPSSPNSQNYALSPVSQQTTTSRSQSSQQPPSPSGRPPSLYSQYSFYSLPNSTPPESPRAVDQPRQLKPKASGSQLNPANQSQQSSRSGSPNKQAPSAAQQALQLGISAHEKNNLRESARYFERSATIEGGCGVGMLMWGLSLRHGWGCRKDERTGFKWLRKAAEAAVTDLEGARSGEEAKAVKNELVLAIYEVGQCFFHGWGVGQDKVMAVSYFQVAARLGDCDAQQELAFCYLNGKGCKKDMRQAARWYRAAAAQGASTVGLAWIYKPKYA